MSSGIYLLTFKDGSFYIGKSTNIEKRFSQHNKSMDDGSHTKKVQEAYDRYGSPEQSVLMYCHADHIDIMETYYINENWNNSLLLNTTRPPRFTQKDVQLLVSTLGDNIWKQSTFEHIITIDVLRQEVKRLKDKLQNFGSLDEDEKYIYSQQLKIQALQSECEKMKKASLWERIFGW